MKKLLSGLWHPNAQDAPDSRPRTLPFVWAVAGALILVGALTLLDATPAHAFEDIANSYCSTTTNQTCNVNADCPSTETCMTALGCIDGIDNDGDGFTDGGFCSATTTTSCQIAADCPATETCVRTLGDPDCVVEMYCQDGVDNDRDGNTDFNDTDCQCLDDVFNAGNCTANDVKFVTVGLGIQDDGCVSTNDTVSIFLGAELETTATTRYDIGMWIDTNGGDARGATCSVTTTTSCTVDGDCPASEICAGRCDRQMLQPTASPYNPFLSFCSVGASACTSHVDCPLFNIDADPPGEICEISSYSLQDTDKCGEIGTGDAGLCSVTTTTPCSAASDCPATENCDLFSPTKHANFIWPYAVTLPCLETSPNGFVALSRCSTWSNSAGGITCNSIADAGPETTSKCRCVDVPPTNIPLPEVVTNCTCDSPTTVPPGFPVTCTIDYDNTAAEGAGTGICSGGSGACTTEADCSGQQTCNICLAGGSEPERFRCATAGFLRMDLVDDISGGVFSGVCGDSGNCSVTTGTSCSVDANCPATETCVSKGWCSTTTSTSCSTASDCPATESCVSPTCTADSDCPAAASSGTCSVDGDLGSAEAVGFSTGLEWTPQSGLGSQGIIGPGDSDSLTFTYTIDGGAGTTAIDLTLTPTWVNNGTCSTTSSTSCQSDANCPSTETCVPDFTDNPKSQTIIETTCTINSNATHVTVSSFRAFDNRGEVELEWATASEVGTLGFNLFRWEETTDRSRRSARTGHWVQVNENLLPAQQHLPGGIYRLIDPLASPNEENHYRLVEVSLTGAESSSKIFPVNVEEREEWAPGISGQGVFEAANVEPSARILERLESSRMESRAEVVRVDLAFKATQLKIHVEEAGLVLLGAEEIATASGQRVAWVQRSIASGRFELSNRGKSVAWEGTDSGAGILFYAEAVDSPFTRDNVYWLAVGSQTPMGLQGGAAPVPVEGPISFVETTHYEEDLLGRPHVAQDPLDDYWFWNFVLTDNSIYSSASFDLDVRGLAPTSESAALVVHFNGFSNPVATPVHRAEVLLNGQLLGEIEGAGKGNHSSQLWFDQSLLQEGDNVVEVVGLAGDFFVDSFDVRYGRLYQAVDDEILVRGDANPVITVSGFSESDLLVYDLRDPRSPERVNATTVDQDAQGFRVSFRPARSLHTYLVTAASNIGSSRSVSGDAPSNLRNRNNRAEYVVIAPSAIIDAARELAGYRKGTGLATLVADIEDVYDEFSHGIADPRAIRDFLAFAHEEWRAGPLYALLAGKGSYDYRDLDGLGGNLVPPLMVSTASGLVPSDNAYGDSNSDGVPEVAVGRLPVLSAGELRGYLDKIRAYEASKGGEWAQRVLMVADDSDSAGNFGRDSDTLQDLLPGSLNVQRVHLLKPYSVSEARNLVLGGIDQGAVLANFVGHGGFDRLAAEGLVTSADVAALDNQERLPVVTGLTCNIGMFAFPGFSSLGEQLVLHETGGAAAVFGPMGLSFNTSAVGMGEDLIPALFSERTLGDAMVRALEDFAAAGGDADTMRAYGLLGDPALVLAD